MPIFEILLQNQGTHVGVQMQNSGPINVQNRVETVPIPIEKKFRNLKHNFLKKKNPFSKSNMLTKTTLKPITQNGFHESQKLFLFREKVEVLDI